MTPPPGRSWRLPREEDLGLLRVRNDAGVVISVLPNGVVFSIEHRQDNQSILVNQILGSLLGGSIGRIVLRLGGARPTNRELVGPHAKVRLGVTDQTIAWEGGTGAVGHRVTLRTARTHAAWLWRVDVTNAGDLPVPVDAILMQDLGLGMRAFVSNNEAYASQYIDHHVARDPRLGPVLISRQNLAQDGRHPQVMHGCLDGASAYATDAMQLFGPRHRDADSAGPPFGTSLPDRRLQHEVACAAIQSLPVLLEPRASATWRFFALYDPDHPAASDDGDLARLNDIEWPQDEVPAIATRATRRSFVQDSKCADVAALSRSQLAQRYPERLLEEVRDRRLLSFFTPEPPHNRHVVLQAKERVVTRRHGAIVRSGASLLPRDDILCATCWMHGVFAAQLTLGNTSFHKLFSVSRDPYNLMRTSGLRALVDVGNGWRLLTIPSAFEMGLSDCRWVYALSDRVITLSVAASADDAAMQWRVAVEGEPCRFLIYGHLVLGESELEHAGTVEVDAAQRRFIFQPDPASLWGHCFPEAVYHLVISTPDAVEAIGGGELLYRGEGCENGAHIAIRTYAVRDFCFAVVGSLTDAAEAARLANEYATPRDDSQLRAPATAFWTRVTRGTRIAGTPADIAALNASLPWLAHDAIIHLSAPRGLEQYTGAAWGTRDVCQGPVEFLLALEHDEAVREILRIVFEQQDATRGDWPQWFMLEPYSHIRDRHSHGDVIIWPLKALNDYLEATNDLAFLEQPLAWRDDVNDGRTAGADPVAVHVDKMLVTMRARFIPGTHLMRYGEGDWNDSLQPADPALRETMASSWTVALMYQQLVRYVDVLHRAGRAQAATAVTELARRVRHDFNRHLVRDGTVAGYAIVHDSGSEPELLLHPSDKRTGLRYSLLPMTRSIIAGLFTPEQAQHHLRLIREHLLFPDGVRLMDRPVAYHGGTEHTFRRAESAAFFGREIGLMYVHAHLRYAEAMAVLGEARALWEALQVVNPVGIGAHVANAAPRQRNAYFSSSDAEFADRYEASRKWARVRAGTIPVEGGWRIYSSGPGLYLNVLLRHALGMRRLFGTRVTMPVVPASFGPLRIDRT